MAQISLRVDDTTKTLAEQTCNELGITMSAAITMFLKKWDGTLHQGLPVIFFDFTGMSACPGTVIQTNDKKISFVIKIL